MLTGQSGRRANPSANLETLIQLLIEPAGGKHGSVRQKRAAKQIADSRLWVSRRCRPPSSEARAESREPRAALRAVGELGSSMWPQLFVIGNVDG